MAKETAPPKAVNIIRPTHSFTPTNKASSRVSSSSSSIVSHSSFISAPPTLARKPVRVASGARILQDKPALNIYHPPSPPQKKSTSASRLPPTPPSPPARPHFEIYKPSRGTKPTTRVIPTTHHSDQYPSQQRPKPQRARSVLGPISRPEEIIRPVIQHEPDELSDMNDDDQHDTSPEDQQEVSDNSDEEEDEEDDEDSPVNEARVNRMIEDLEISNRSLLAVNRMLEANLRKRTSEVAQMKRQLNGQAPVVIPPLPMPSEDQPSDEDDDAEWEKDETFCRLRQMTESMIEYGQNALDYKVKGLGRVLSQYEDSDDEEDEEKPNEPLDHPQQQPLS